MIVPRSFQHVAPPSRPAADSEKAAHPTRTWERARTKTGQKEMGLDIRKPARMSSAPAATASKPMVVPTRTHSGGGHKTKEVSYEKRSFPNSDLSGRQSAAALEVKTMPVSIMSSTASRRKAEGPRNLRFDGRSRRNNNGEEAPKPVQRSMSACSPQSWGMLLSPPDELSPDICSIGSDSALNAASFVRSMSNESTPSLETDYGSSHSASGTSTPETIFGSRGGSERRSKDASSFEIEDCLLNHPLLPHRKPEPVSPESSAKENEHEDPQLPAWTRRKSAFKSNLTASLSILRSAARSVSHLAAPAVSRDDYLTRSLLPMSPPFTDERRPLPSSEPPDPALRRYLNPITGSPAELHMHHEHPPSHKARSRCTASVQLQTYQRAPRPSSNASAPPVFTSSSSSNANAAIAAAANEPFSTPSPRQREPRENGDFLRVIVLEMNMRRSGTMSDTAPGKAKMWLPARQAGTRKDDRQKGEVPRQWVGTTM